MGGGGGSFSYHYLLVFGVCVQNKGNLIDHLIHYTIGMPYSGAQR